MVILRPRASRIAAMDAEVMPLPNDETTPPVMKINRVIGTPSLSFGPVLPSIDQHSQMELQPTRSTRQAQFNFGNAG